MEEIINDLKEKLSQEQEKCKRLQNDLSSYNEKESKMSQSITSVSIFFFILMSNLLFSYSILKIFNYYPIYNIFSQIYLTQSCFIFFGKNRWNKQKLNSMLR